MDYAFSTLLPEEAYVTDGLCDNIPVRIHRWANYEISGSLQAQNDWEKFVSPLKNFNGGLGERFGFMTVAMPECLPERFELVSYANEFAFLYDDIVDNATQEDVEQYNTAILTAFNEGVDGLPSTNRRGIRQVQAKIISKMMEMDRRAAVTAMKAWGEFIESSSAREHHRDFSSLEEYLPYRCKDVGHMFWHALMIFGCNLTIPEHEFETVTELIMPAVKAASLTNDLYSYKKEHLAAMEAGKPNVANAIWVLMKAHQLTEEAAKETCIRLIKDEVEALTQVMKVIHGRTDISRDARKYVELMQYSVSGNVVWSRECPRYHQNIDTLPGFNCSKSRIHSLENKRPFPCISIGSPLTPDDSASSIDEDSKSAKRRRMHGDNLEEVSPSPDYSDLSCSASHPKLLPISMDDSLIATPLLGSIANTEVVMEPYRYTRSLPSKGIRDKVIDALNFWFEVPDHNADTVKAITSLLHSSSLMLDDIEDNSRLRRGKPSAFVVYGTAQTINSATFLYVDALCHINRLGCQRLVRIFSEEMRNLFIGQSHDIFWTRELTCPSVTQYLHMVDGKTGGLFRLLTRLLCELSPHRHTVSLDQLTCLFGRFFQIRDDYQNLVSSEYTSMKGYCEDLDEGKFSLPLIHALQNTKQVMELRGLLQNRRDHGSLTREQKVIVIEHMEKAGSFSYTRQVLQTLRDALEAEIIRLEGVFKKQNFELRLMLDLLKV